MSTYADNRRCLGLYWLEGQERQPVVIDEGWVSMEGDELVYFRPARGSNGFALYTTEAKAKQSADAGEKQQKVRLVLEFVDA